MTMTNEEMGVMIDILSTLDEKGKLGYAIARNLRKLTDASKEYQDMRVKLFQEYGEQLPDGKSMRIRPENNQKYLDDMGDIPKISHEVEIFKIDPEDFFSGNLTSSQMANLMWMVKDEPEKIDGEEVE